MGPQIQNRKRRSCGKIALRHSFTAHRSLHHAGSIFPPLRSDRSRASTSIQRREGFQSPWQCRDLSGATNTEPEAEKLWKNCPASLLYGPAKPAPRGLNFSTASQRPDPCINVDSAPRTSTCVAAGIRSLRSCEKACPYRSFQGTTQFIPFAFSQLL